MTTRLLVYRGESLFYSVILRNDIEPLELVRFGKPTRAHAVAASRHLLGTIKFELIHRV